MSAVLAILALCISVVSAVTAIGLWRNARRANRTAIAIATRDAARRHEETAPEFDIGFEIDGTDGHSGWLNVQLIRGPDVLDVEVRIQDETGQDHWGRGLPEHLSYEDAQKFVWGPWEFNINASDQVVSYRETKVRQYTRLDGHDWDRLHLSRTRPGVWMRGMSDDQWQEQRKGPIRLLVTSSVDGEPPWHQSYLVRRC